MLAYLSMLSILELASTAGSARQFRNKQHTQVSELCQKHATKMKQDSYDCEWHTEHNGILNEQIIRSINGIKHFGPPW